MSSVQTGQLISLLINNVLMVIIAAAVTLVAWLRWHWVRVEGKRTQLMRRRCRWAYISFVLTAVTLLGMLSSLGILALRALVSVNALVIVAMGLFVLSVVTLLVALGLWLFDLCCDIPMARRQRGIPPMTFLPISVTGMSKPQRLSRRAQRKTAIRSRG